MLGRRAEKIVKGGRGERTGARQTNETVFPWFICVFNEGRDYSLSSITSCSKYSNRLGKTNVSKFIQLNAPKDLKRRKDEHFTFV